MEWNLSNLPASFLSRFGCLCFANHIIIGLTLSDMRRRDAEIRRCNLCFSISSLNSSCKTSPRAKADKVRERERDSKRCYVIVATCMMLKASAESTILSDILFSFSHILVHDANIQQDKRMISLSSISALTALTW